MGLQRNDILWKAMLEDFFADFLRFFFEDADEVFDFKKGFVFLDKELAEVFPAEEVRHPKYVDKLVRVFTKQGKKEWMLIHVEVQGYSQAVFARRMFTYYSRLMDKYHIPVTCMAIFLGKRNKNNAAFFETACLGSKIRFDFNAYYVGEQREDILEKHTNPFAVVILAALVALKHRKSTADLFNSKVALARNLIRSGLPAEKVRRLLDFISQYLHFEEKELNIKFERQIELLTDKTTKSMGITEMILDLAKKDGIEIGERRGMKKGELQGLKKGELRGLKKGELRGLEKGEQKVKNTKNAIARQLKSLGIAPAIISKSTGLTLRQISEL